MLQSKLSKIFKPKTVAIVGASEKRGPGFQVIENLRALDYKGEIVPINPKYDRVLGLKCFPSLIAVKEAGLPVDIVAILLGKENVLPILKEAALTGVKGAWSFAAGFGETGTEGKLLENELQKLCNDYNINFLGPNCVGYLNTNDNTGIYSAPVPKKIKKGNIGMVTQSGYLGLAVANNSRGLGLGMICTTGNEIVIDVIDCIEYMINDERIEVILAFIEQFRRPEKLIEIAKKAGEKEKPIVLIKVGKSAIAQRATITHTGALAGSDDIQDALFKKLGIIRVDDFDEMFETAVLLSKTRAKKPKGNKAFALTLSGGLISLIGDLSESFNMCFPHWDKNGEEKLSKILPDFSPIANPLDAWGSGYIEKTYLPCLQAAAEQEQADMLLVIQDVPGGMSKRQTEQYMVVADAAVRVAQNIEKPIIMLSNQSSSFNDEIYNLMENRNVPLLQGTKEGLAALNHLIDYSSFLKEQIHYTLSYSKTRQPSKTILKLLSKDEKVLNEFESKKLIEEYGIPITRNYLCRSKSEVFKRAEELGYPLVMKLISEDIQHKTEAGVVKLNIKNLKEVEQSYDGLISNAFQFKKDAKIKGILCYKMIEDPVTEIIIGIVSDPYFGPAVLFGLGGIFVEVLKDRTLLIPPFTRGEVIKKINSLKGSQLLYGVRGKPEGDIEALTSAVVKVGEIAVNLGKRIDSLDINPLFVLPKGKGVIAVDALISIK